MLSALTDVVTAHISAKLYLGFHHYIFDNRATSDAELLVVAVEAEVLSLAVFVVATGTDSLAHLGGDIKVKAAPARDVGHGDSLMALSGAPGFLVMTASTSRDPLRLDNNTVPQLTNLPRHLLGKFVGLVEIVVVAARAAVVETVGRFVTQVAPLAVRAYLVLHPHPQLIMGRHYTLMTLAGAFSSPVVTPEARPDA